MNWQRLRYLFFSFAFKNHYFQPVDLLITVSFLFVKSDQVSDVAKRPKLDN